jgi:3-oxoacyl-[acyl-carrier protein] reductase
MEFIPRSHKNIEGYQKDTRPFHQRIINEHFLDIPDSVLSSRVAVPLKRGQFMLFHSGILHRSLPAKGNDFSRYSLVARLCKKNTDIPIELAQEDEIFEYPIKLNEEKRFSDKVALVTGGSRGIGKAIAAGLVKEGAKVVITGRNASKLEQAVSEISANCTKYTSIFAIKADAADFEQMEVAYKSLFDKFGPPDIVFANAATNRPNGSIHSLSHDQWFGMVSSNIQATFNTCKLAAQYMHDWGGNIITLGSAIGHNGAANNSAYAVSKAANWTLTQSLAQELNNKHINVNELIPGPVITDMNFGASGSVWKQPEDVVPTALLLAEQNLKFGATGQSWVIKRL